MSSSKTTIDHEEIRGWVEERGGNPATVNRTTDEGEAGILRIDYPGFSGEETLHKISWEEFFEKFDEENLAFLYQDETSSGETSRFSKFVDRAAMKKSPGKSSAGSKASSTRKKASGGGAGTRASGGASANKSGARQGPEKRATEKRQAK